MESGEIVDKRFAQLAGRVGVSSQPFRRLSAQDDSLHAFHHVEGRAEHRRVFTVKKRLRSLRVGEVQLRQHAVLSTHIMRSFDLTAERGTAQHHLTVTQRHQIGQVGMAAGKLCNAKSAGGVGKMTTQERFEPGQIEFFSGSYKVGWSRRSAMSDS